MAREVQASLLPQRLPQIPGFELAASWHAAREVAGDFYDIFPLPEGRWGLVIGDVSDKGAPAALYMTMVHSLIRATAGFAASPAETLLIVNESLEANSSSDMFVSVFLGVLEPQACSLVYANAGHDPPLLRRLSRKIERLVRTGPILGVFEGVAWVNKSVDFAAGDALLAYTDGVTDALNIEGEEYSSSRLADVAGQGAATAAAYLAQIESDLSAFIGQEPQTDDITLLIIKSIT
jgi:sigma-B regulation protein RsbU (phosphoserine phosphatase)